jgi:flagellar biosynthesis anti-sigma factor FlgM
MPDISSIGQGSVGPLERTDAAHGRRDDATAPARDASERDHDRRADRVELSDHARFLDRLRHLPDVRQEHIERIRQAIADGTYETPEKIEIALGRILEDLLSS